LTSFNIQSQQAGTIQNVGGDLTVNGGVHSSATFDAAGLRGELAKVQDEVSRLPLDPAQQDIAAGHLAIAADEAAQLEPDRERVSGHVRRAAEVVQDAGALATGSGALLESLVRIGRILGPAGRALLGVLGCL
jgi:hypothetical protein